MEAVIYYINSRGATKMEFANNRAFSKIRKFKKFGTYKFNTIDIK